MSGNLSLRDFGYPKKRIDLVESTTSRWKLPDRQPQSALVLASPSQQKLFLVRKTVVDSGNQQRILGYFIEEAKEHLDTLEHGLLELRSIVKEPDRVNELFRAAHSVKGGAAMLGYGSIQKTAHRLEDSFKVLQEHPIQVDQKLETLFLRGYDTLKDLIDQLQGPFGLQEDDAKKTVEAAEKNFAQLHSYLDRLVSAGSAPAEKPSTPRQKAKPGAPTAKFVPQVTPVLKQMLQLFKQRETPENRQKLQSLCKRLAQLGIGIDRWQELVQLSHKAIANSQNQFSTLAPVIIKELKHAGDLVQAGKSDTIAPSPHLKNLGSATPATPTPPTEKPDGRAKQITLPLEPKAAAKALIQAFDKPQLTQLTKILAQAVRSSSGAAARK
jgi:chemotaxis protein histidine kinase CheA